VDPVERVEQLREEYERALAAVEERRLAYHKALLELIERGGPDLEALAEDLGLLERHLEEVVETPVTRRRRGRAAAAVGLGLALLGAAAAGLWVARAPPFVPTVRVPRVLTLREAPAVRRLEQAGLRARVVSLRREIPRSLARRVLGVSEPPGALVPRGSTVTLYVAVLPRPGPRRSGS
jgi:hypothetical protein